MHRFALGLSVYIWASTVVAADKPELGPPPSWVQPSLPSASIGERTDAAVKIILQDQQLNFTPSADEVYSESMVHIQTPQGLAMMGTLSLPWKPDTDTLTVHKLHILRGDTVIDVLGAGQTFTVLRRENNLDYAVLDGILTAVIQPAGLQVGDTLDLAYSVKRSDPVLAGISERIISGWTDMPVSRLRIRARWAKPDSIRWKTSDALTGVKEKRLGDISEVALALDNVEPLPQPEGAPLRFLAERRIEFSSFKSWTEVARRLAPLYARAAVLSPSSPLHAEIERLRAVSSEPRVQAAAALALVQDQVRYVFLGMNDGGQVPAEADLTWSRRFGDCKGKTVLLLALLRALDIDADAVVVSASNGDGLEERLPMIGLFDHVLVRAVIEGKTYWLDGTRVGDRRLEDLAVPHYYWGLPLLSSGGELVRMLASPLTEPGSETSIRIDATAGIRIPAPFHVESILKGDSATALKLQLASLTSSDLDRSLRAYWAKKYDFVEIQSVSAKFDDRTGEERLTMDGSARMKWDGDWYETDGLGLGYRADFSRPPGPNRDAPFAVPFPVFTRVSESILLPQRGAHFTIEGENIDRTVAGVEYRRRAIIENGVFTAQSSTRSIASEFPITEAEAAQKILRKMAKDTLYIRAPENYQITKQELDAELAKTPQTAGDYIDRGNMLLDRNDYDRAIADLDRALALDPKADIAWADRGLAYLGKGNSELARKDLDAAFAINPRNAVVFRGRGTLALNAGKLPEAIAAFSTSLELEPKSAYALGMRARAYVRRGEYEKALADGAEAIRLWPSYIDMYSLRAGIFRNEGQIDKAVDEAESLVVANADNASAYIAAGAIYYSVKKNTEAMHAFDRAVEIEPAEASYLARARYRPRTDMASKRSDAEAALKLNPRSLNALGMLAWIQTDAREYMNAVETLNAALAIEDDSYGLLIQRGIAYAKSDRSALADKDFAAARAKATSATDLNNICWQLATAGVALASALEACDSALAKGSAWPAFNDSRGFVLLRLGRYDDAIAAYDTALKAIPTYPASLYGRGVAKRRKGDVSGSDADIQTALAANADIGGEFAAYGVTP